MTTINDFPALPASEETSDFSRDVSFANAGEIRVGDAVRVMTGTFSYIEGKVYWKRGDTIEVTLRVFGMEIVRDFHWTNLKKVG